MPLIKFLLRHESCPGIAEGEELPVLQMERGETEDDEVYACPSCPLRLQSEMYILDSETVQ
jgi:hypothetical protein